MIPFVDLKAQYQQIKTEINDAIGRVLESTQFTLGPEVEALEREFAAYCQAGHTVCVNSGTSALHLALLASDIGPGDEVITVPFTFVATAAAIIYAGAKPVFVDINPDAYTIESSQIEQAITSRTKAIMPVHLYGQPADMDEIRDIGRRHSLLVIEDAAQAHGAEYKGRRVGGLGDLGCFSFYPGKNLGAYGEGGAVVTNNQGFADKVRMLRDWGQAKKYQHVLKGYNYRMEGIQGAILRVKLGHLDRWNELRRLHAALYGELLKPSNALSPVEMAYSKHVYHVYAIRLRERDKVQSDLQSDGIQTGIHYPVPVHLQPCYADLGYKAGQFPEAEKASKEVLSLPMFPELNEKQIRDVASAVRNHAVEDIHG